MSIIYREMYLNTQSNNVVSVFSGERQDKDSFIA